MARKIVKLGSYRCMSDFYKSKIRIKDKHFVQIIIANFISYFVERGDKKACKLKNLVEEK